MLKVNEYYLNGRARMELAVTGLPTLFSSMRYKEHTDETKTLWICEARQWDELDGRKMLNVGALTWFGDKGPWAVFTVEEVVYNVDVSDYVRDRGI